MQIKQTLNYVEKKWGYEKWIVNNELYCGKELYCKKGVWSSEGRFHYHKNKDETFYVIEGTLRLVIEEDAMLKQIVLEVGESYRIRPHTKHKFTADTSECKFIEISTFHSDDDSYRE